MVALWAEHTMAKHVCCLLSLQDYLYTIVSKSKVEGVYQERVSVAGPIKDMVLAPEAPGEVNGG